MDKNTLWKKCAAFHGHECGGLTIGYKAALYALELLDISLENVSENPECISKDEDLVCIAENDACGVDAIQVILGCSVGKGNLLFHLRGKQAFSFYNRRNGKSVRLVLKPRPAGMTREESFAYFQALEPEELRRRMQDVRYRMLAAGAHYVVDSIEELPALIESINEKMNKE